MFFLIKKISIIMPVLSNYLVKIIALTSSKAGAWETILKSTPPGTIEK